MEISRKYSYHSNNILVGWLCYDQLGQVDGDNTRTYSTHVVYL